MKSLRLSLGFVVMALSLGGAAHAATTVPDATAFENIGLNFAMYGRSHTGVGTADVSNLPGCAGTCTATAALGDNPYVSVAIDEVEYQATSGGGAQAQLSYYFEYQNAAGSYQITMDAPATLSSPDGAPGSASLEFGKGYANNPNQFDGPPLLQEAQCINGCPNPGFSYPNAPIVPLHTFTLQANTIYLVKLEVRLSGYADHTQDTITMDPTFSDHGAGGTFVFSQGVTQPSADVPEPATWALMLMGFGGLGAGLRARRRTALQVG